VDQADLLALIRPGVPGPGTWAELGSGDGNFTLALAELLQPGGKVYSVDRVGAALSRQRQRVDQAHLDGVTFEFLEADFTKPLDLPSLDGVLMANSLHFVRRKEETLRLVRGYLKPAGRLLLVEYAADRGNPWVPYPMSFETWKLVAVAAGFSEPRQLGLHPSRWLNGIYSAVSVRQ